MYILKALPEQVVPFVTTVATNTTLRFRLDGLPGGLDVIKMELYAAIVADRSTSHDDPLTVAEQVALFQNISMDAYGENIINRMSGIDMLELAAMAGEGGAGAGPLAATWTALGTAVTDAQLNVPIIIPFYDRRQDERGSAYDTAQDSSLLLQGGTIDLTFQMAAKNWNNANTSIRVGIIFYCMPRTGVYARPYKRYFKVAAPSLRGVRLERGVFSDILFVDNATRTAASAPALASGITADQSSLLSAEYAGVQFKNSVRIMKNNELELSAVEGQGVAAILTALGNALELGSLAIVHTNHNELGEISKFRRSPNAEGLLDLVAGASVLPGGAPTAGNTLYCELKPAGREHLLRVAQTYGIPADQAITVLGPDSDPWMPKQLA